MPLSPASSVRSGMPLGLTGAQEATRYVGGTASGAPASGTFAVGDFVVDQSGVVHVCTAAGSPGTWTAVGGTPAARTLFSSTLSGDAASIDTGAAGIAATASALMVLILARTAIAAVGSSVTITVNADASAIYDLTYVQNLNTTVTGVTSLAQTSWVIAAFGDSALAGVATALQITIPRYAGTTFFKQGTCIASQVEDTAADARERVYSLGYRATTAISRMAVAGNGGDLKAGSSMVIVGLG